MGIAIERDGEQWSSRSKMGWPEGFEPSNAGITIRSVNPFAMATIRYVDHT